MGKLHSPCRLTGKPREAGASLMEAAVVLGVAAVIMMAAVFYGFYPFDSTNRLAMQLSHRAAALQGALADWYLFEHCSGQAQQARVPLAQSASLPSGVPSAQDLGPYLLDASRVLEETGDGAYQWQVNRGAHLPVGVVFWTPPDHFSSQSVEALGRRLGAECETSACSRLAWPEHIIMSHDPQRRGLQRQWLQRYGINCDQDDDTGVLDSVCDSDDDGLLGPGTVLEQDGVSYALIDLDSNEDGRLDHDHDLNLVVDATDYGNWGC